MSRRVYLLQAVAGVVLAIGAGIVIYDSFRTGRAPYTGGTAGERGHYSSSSGSSEQVRQPKPAKRDAREVEENLKKIIGQW